MKSWSHIICTYVLCSLLANEPAVKWAVIIAEQDDDEWVVQGQGVEVVKQQILNLPGKPGLVFNMWVLVNGGWYQLLWATILLAGRQILLIHNLYSYKICAVLNTTNLSGLSYSSLWCSPPICQISN